MKKYMILLALLLVLSVGTSAALMAQVPSVDISGVTGGSTWLWLEAENASSTTGTGELTYILTLRIPGSISIRFHPGSRTVVLVLRP